MILPTLLLISLVIFVPAIRSLLMAFQDYNMYFLTKKFIGFKNFCDAFKDPLFLLAIKNTFIWVFVSLIVQFSLGFSLALLLRKPFKGRSIYTGLVFYPWAVSGFVIGLQYRWMFHGSAGVINDLLLRAGLISERIAFLSDPKYALYSAIIANIWYGVPFFAIMLLAALQSVPQELYEAAKIDGANSFRRFISVTIPYVKPVIVNTTLIRFIWIFNFPDIIFSMTNGGPAGSSHILSTLLISKVYNEYNYGIASAIGVTIMAILVLYSYFYLKFSRSEGGF
ncbi:MAG TPA: sugar ABC transporter permease [Pseudothermotoga sp.]|jgi:multiple sugar transport system permease protein|nr:MAG: Binding-protein-dependent transport systems inner membrane component [Pseudothermotoga lettingae]MDK2885385.1 multiple sugar transport system permease protein [Pseudothermotoga sp.]HBJ80473.1 sugar ABC transporter permease [Pseudothermotoga sp.]HBT25257.1 sugar ABC transporter permease [Pseudothermotoga sp.]